MTTALVCLLVACAAGQVWLFLQLRSQTRRLAEMQSYLDRQLIGIMAAQGNQWKLYHLLQKKEDQ